MLGTMEGVVVGGIVVVGHIKPDSLLLHHIGGMVDRPLGYCLAIDTIEAP